MPTLLCGLQPLSLLSASGGRGANGAQSWHLAAGHGGCEVIRAGDKLCVHGHGRVIDTQSQSCLSCFSIASIEKPVFFSPWETEVGLGRDKFLPDPRAPVPIATAWLGLCCLSVLFCSTEGLNCRVWQILLGFKLFQH